MLSKPSELGWKEMPEVDSWRLTEIAVLFGVGIDEIYDEVARK